MDKQRLEEIKKELLEKKKQQKNEWIDYWNNLKPFEGNPDRIPDVPIVKDKKQYEEIIVKNLIRCGAIPKEQLEVGKTYLGTCRNFSKAVWNGIEFEGKRYKFGMWQDDTINHFQDDDGYDLFVPIKKLD